ncbi:MAG: hypothetical protein WD751_03275 [Anaerolineales bacterium]
MSKGVIFNLATDLFFAPSIAAAAEALGCSVKVVDGYQDAAAFLDLMRAEKPDLIILDLNSSLPWIEWLPAAKAEPLLKATPWLAHGSHMNPRRLAAARKAGADLVAPKSQFSAELGGLMQTLLAK